MICENADKCKMPKSCIHSKEHKHNSICDNACTAGTGMGVRGSRCVKTKEAVMKDKVSIESLIDDGACADGVRWFIKTFGENGLRYGVPSKEVFERLMFENLPMYYGWLKDHGYECGDKTKVKVYKYMYKSSDGKWYETGCFLKNDSEFKNWCKYSNFKRIDSSVQEVEE